MKICVSSCLLAVLFFGLGCSRGRMQGAGWTYSSTDPDFTLDLPTAEWKKVAKTRYIADFWCPSRTGSPMLAGVTSMKKQTHEEFQASLPTFKSRIEKGGNFLVNPVFEEGKTATGNVYVFAHLCEKGSQDSEFIYAASAAVWIPAKGTTVTTIFEGQARMQSNTFQSIEYADFEAAAKLICLSPK